MQTVSSPRDATFMREALVEAEAAFRRGDRPIGAVIVHDDRIIARGSNTFASGQSAVGHAELNAILASAAQLREYGHDCTIYTTVEPCVMCLGAIIMANIRGVVYGMPDNHIQARLAIDTVPYIRRRVWRYVGGVLQDECVELYRRFSEEEAALCLHGVPAGG